MEDDSVNYADGLLLSDDDADVVSSIHSSALGGADGRGVSSSMSMPSKPSDRHSMTVPAGTILGLRARPRDSDRCRSMGGRRRSGDDGRRVLGDAVAKRPRGRPRLRVANRGGLARRMRKPRPSDSASESTASPSSSAASSSES